MNDLIEQLTRVRGVGGCVVLSNDGLTIASQLRSGLDEDALSAAIADLIERCDRFVNQSQLGQGLITIFGSEGALAVSSVGNGYLALIIDPNANMALLRLDTQPFITALNERLTM